ncbi:MAG TPA: ABC transporter permease [Dinghuibacter sp.]|uniref:ABC transporter permease n=1 Tax=Dinghuibacter sp. TaxID=2024697 RepID=UPI002B7FC775|nr:ABC transporter permease [Dinghuibacter sp.]HTJ14290.1 ABC transporter permease [Dinghuibacter sp.]
MIRNYFKIALRSLWRKRGFSLLNILGLSVGIGAALVLFLIIRFELSFDTYHAKKDRIYRVVTHSFGGPEGDHLYQGVPVPLAPELRQSFPQLEKVACTFGIINPQFTITRPGQEDLMVKENAGVTYVEPAIFGIFDQPWLAGDPASLSEPNTVAIDASVARNWFGSSDAAMGKVVQMDRSTPLTVTGVMTDPPDNTDLAIRIAVSYATYAGRTGTNWHNWMGNFNCYALLGKGQHIEQVERSIDAFAARFYDNKGPGEKESFAFQPLSQVHYDPRLGTNTGKITPPGLLWGLGLVGAFLVLIACINFINLATAQSVQRSKEIGVRKVLGSSRKSLAAQFLGETGVIVFLSLLLACIMAELSLPYFRQLLNEPIYLNISDHPSILVFILLMGIAVTLLAGLYPALVVSGLNPIRAIRNASATGNARGRFLRRGLVVFQFLIAQLLMVGSIVIMEQIHFLKNMPLGFDKESVALVNLPTDSLSQTRFPYTQRQMEAIPGVQSVSLCLDAPSARRTMTTSFTFETKMPDFGIVIRFADTAYFRTFHLGLAAGRLPFASDTMREVLVNETAARQLGFKDASGILGRKIDVMGGSFPIVGVMKDFSSSAPMSAIPPLMLSTNLSYYQYIAIRFDPRQGGRVMAAVQKQWKDAFPGYAYEQHFMDENVAKYFTLLSAMEKLIRIFASIALIVSCLGLYGLVSFMVVQKTKEVGIRKVLGASVQSILVLFSREFTLLIGLAFLVAAPVGYWLMHMALANFANRITIGWDVFVWVMGSSILVAWVTVGYRALRAALADPVKALKYE